MRHQFRTLSFFLFIVFLHPPVPAEKAELAWYPKQSEIEKRLMQKISEKRMEQHLQWLTSRPHRAGSQGTRITVEYLQKQMRQYGFQTEVTEYIAYLPEPVSVSLRMLQPLEEELPTTEERIDGDPYTKHVAEHPGWNGYSPSGEETGDVVYAHHGSEEDFKTLQKMGIDLKGKIVLMRYFDTGEGQKVRNAEKHGASGVVLYSDPAEDGYHYGDVYPKGNWRPWGSIMRRSIIALPYEGDPLSPGWASVRGAKRLKPQEVPLHRIPVLPVSYRTAEKILRHLKGPVAPYDWQGHLPITYKVGPGPARLRIVTKMDNRDRPIFNVIGTLRGNQDPDQWVILSNHHDAWIFGAGDPSSGTASLLELSRAIGELVKEGYRPRRTLIVAFWDAEEMLLGGSTEWVEHHSAELLQKAVACINMDSSVFNPERPLSVSAHPALHQLFRNATRKIPDPRTKKSTFEVWTALQNQYRQVPSVDGWGAFFDPNQPLSEPHIFASPYDDAAPFYQYLALPSSDMYYGADYGMYHSIYENFHWMKTVVDPTFGYHAVMAKLQGLVGWTLANAEILPLDYAAESDYWQKSYNMLNEAHPGKVPRLKQAHDLIRQWKNEAIGLRKEIERLLSSPRRRDEKQLRELNRKIYLIARDFYRPNGRPEMPAERNLFAGSSFEFENVSGGTLPGIRFALDQGQMQKADRESKLYLAALQKRVKNLRQIKEDFRRLR